jgi:hypothetical protein
VPAQLRSQTQNRIYRDLFGSTFKPEHNAVAAVVYDFTRTVQKNTKPPSPAFSQGIPSFLLRNQGAKCDTNVTSENDKYLITATITTKNM